ncbi:MAG: ScaI family restriction endonuclease [Dolichospermum sp.]
MVSPYLGIPVEKWADKTKELIEEHPLDANEIYEIVISVWEEIFQSSITSRGYKIGRDIFPSPQIIGSLLHELIPLELSGKYPQLWRREKDTTEKDLVYIPNDNFSIEIKTSSSPRNIFGNRSYAQKSTTGKTKKSKSGYSRVINFEKIENTALCATNWYSSSSEKNSFGVVDSSIRGLLVTTVGLRPKYFSVKTS